MKRILVSLCAILVLTALLFTGCAVPNEKNEDSKVQETTEPTTEPVKTGADLILSTVSQTGVKASIPQNVTSDKEVGLFYFVWEGTGGAYPYIYDNTVILKTLLDTGKDARYFSNFREAGGGAAWTFHWWGEPLFGYYDMADEWVITRHLQMFADAGVDFLILDLTNGVGDGYVARINAVFKTALKLKEQGVNVPKLCFMSYEDATGTVDKLYVQIYKKHPEYAPLFYYWNNNEKPVIFDNISGKCESSSGDIDTAAKLAAYKEGVTDFFELRDVAFPSETAKNLNKDSITYMDFKANPGLNVDQKDPTYTFMNVSVAEICDTMSSVPWFVETSDRTRSWDGTTNRNFHGESDAYLYGYNFARQFEYALTQDPDMIFVTGWNEWIAQLQGPGSYWANSAASREGISADDAYGFVDNGDINNSRDIEPMKDGYGDNYYIQLCSFIQRFKYSNVTENKAAKVTYIDPTAETFERNCQAANVSSIVYTAPAADNDIAKIEITSDADNFIFTIETVDDIKNADTLGNMMVEVKTGDDLSNTFFINRKSGNTVEKYDGSDFTSAGECTVNISGKTMTVSVAKTVFGAQTIYVKVLDGADALDSMTAYTCPESAPYGCFFVKYVA